MAVIYQIKHLSGSLSGRNQRVALDEGQVIRLGRNPENDVRFDESAEDNVSGAHAELVWHDGRLYVVDKRSTNGTFVNGARCPAFERVPVPEGARIRLAQDGPEMELLLEAATAGSPSPAVSPASANGPSPAAAKAGVGRETLLREIDHARNEERERMATEVARTRKISGVSVAIAGAALVLLAAVSVLVVSALLGRQPEEPTPSWSAVERVARPAVGHVMVRYHLTQARDLGDGSALPIEGESGVALGSAVLIAPDLVLTVKHVVEPWRYFRDWEEMEFRDSDHFTELTGLRPVYDRLEIQFPGRQPITVTVRATSETSDLALLSIPKVSIQPVPLELSNTAVQVTDEIASLGYPYDQGTLKSLSEDNTSARQSWVEIIDKEPTFIRGTVSRPVAEAGETSHYFFLDASIEPGTSGGPVLSSEGKVIGIISLQGKAEDTVELLGEPYAVLQEVESAGRAVGPGDIADFLSRAGVR